MFRNMHWATPEERRALGQTRRKQVGRHQHDAVDPKARRASALEIVNRSMRGRVPALKDLKYRLMAESPFGYFRGAAPVMAADLAQLPNTGIGSQLCGDAHVRNLGAYAAPDGRLVFDINDFDETIRGPFEWDLKRMSASLVLAGRAAGHKDGSSRRAVEACIERYAEQMRAFTRMSLIEMNRFQVHRLGLAKPVQAALSKAERATPQHILQQLTVPASPRPGAHRHFKDAKPMLARITGARAALVLGALDPYREMLEPQRQPPARLLPACRCGVQGGRHRLGGSCAITASTWRAMAPPTRSFCRSRKKRRRPTRPIFPTRELPAHNGQRVAEGQRAMQIQTDPFLGWTHIGCAAVSRPPAQRPQRLRSTFRTWPARI